MFEIKIEYMTGNSFGSELTSDELPIVWDSMELAQEVLKRIDEHKKALIDEHYERPSKHDERLENAKKQRWYHDDSDNYVEPKYNLLVPNKDGSKEVVLNAFWAGHFEDLRKAQIVPINGCLDYT